MSMTPANSTRPVSLRPRTADIGELSAREAEFKGKQPAHNQISSVRPRAGRVVSVSGSKVLVLIDRSNGLPDAFQPRTGRLACIETAGTDVVAVITAINAPSATSEEDDREIMIAELELAGEFHQNEKGAIKFRKGITTYPSVGDVAALAVTEDYQNIFSGDFGACRLGILNNNMGTAANFDPKRLIGGNFIITGDESEGKSAAVATIIRSMIKSKFSLTTVVFDHHGEYTRSFGKLANTVDLSRGGLPHWMLSIPELVSLMEDQGSRLSEDEMALLFEMVQAARKFYAQKSTDMLKLMGPHGAIKVTAETPVPYRVADAISYLDRTVHTDERYGSTVYNSLRMKFFHMTQDKNYAAVFSHLSMEDSLGQILANVFRLPSGGRNVTLLQPGAAVPALRAVYVSAFCRMAKMIGDLAELDRPLLLLVEDAEQYLSPSQGKMPVSRQALEALLLSGGKQKTGLGLVTSHPRRLEAEVFDNCRTLFAMRLSSYQDQDYLAGVAPESSMGLLEETGILVRGEAAGLGHAMPMAARFTFDTLPAEAVPGRSIQKSQIDLQPEDMAELPEWLARNWRFGEVLPE